MADNSPVTRIGLECVAGQDEHRRIVVEERVLRIGNASTNPALAITELQPSQGYLLTKVQNGGLAIDAHNCLVPIYVNNQEVMTALLGEQDVLRIGNSVWRLRYPNSQRAGQQGGGAQQGMNPNPRPNYNQGGQGQQGGGGHNAGGQAHGGNHAGGLGHHFSDLIGLEALTDFKLSEVFSEVFKKHTQEEMEDQLITGTSRHTPSLAELSVDWARPWLFARLLLYSVILAVAMYLGFSSFRNAKLIPGLIFIGSFAVPVSTLIFFLEMNIPRNVSIFKTMQLLFVGGVGSIIVALVFFTRLDFFTTALGASAAGIIEESAKLLIVILLMGRAVQYKWILNGLLFGAAVGTGFAAFESAGYAFETMLGSNSVDAGVGNLLLRGMNAPFTHIVWTANSAAALWMVKGDRPFSWNMLGAPAFLRVLISSMVLHMLWNAPFGLLHLPLVLDLKFVLIGVLGWVINLRLIQAGLKQLSRARREAGISSMVSGTIPPGIYQTTPMNPVQ